MKPIYVALIVFFALGCNPQNGNTEKPPMKADIGNIQPGKTYTSSDIFTPTTYTNNTVTGFLDPSGAPTGIEYDVNKLVDMDSEYGYKVTGVVGQSLSDIERIKKIINCAAISAFTGGHYADYRDITKSPDYRSEFNRVSIGLPVECENLHEGSLLKLYLVPVMYDRRIIAVSQVGQYEDKVDYSAVSNSLPNDPERDTLEGDGIYPVFCKSTAVQKFLNHPQFRGKAIDPATLSLKRVYIYTHPDITFGLHLAWRITSANGNFLMNFNGAIFKTSSSYSISSLGGKLPYECKIDVHPLE